MQRTVIHASMITGLLALGGAGLAGFGATDPTPAAQASQAADEFAVDGVHSSVVFKVGYMGVANFYGRFNEVKGAYSIDFDNPSASALDIAIPTESVDSNNSGRDQHLRGADFFSAKEFPTIRFLATEFSKVDDDTMRITGDLSLRGVTKTVSVDLDWLGQRPDPRGGIRSGFEVVFPINRSDFGVSYGIDNGALGDETTITVAITGMRQ